MTHPPPTQRQQQVLDFIKSEIARVSRPPTIREICGRFGWASPLSATLHLRALVRKKKIAIQPRGSRAITVLDKPPRGIPLLTLGQLSGKA